MAILIMPAHERGDSRGKVLAWHKRVGDWVEKGDKLFTYSMESGVYLAVCEQAGRLSAIYLPEGESAPCPADVALISAPTAAGALAFCQLDGLRAGGEGPEAAPEEPAAPEESGETPEEPETSEESETPEGPEAPEESETPEEPEAPEESETPEKPEAPEESETPEKPEAPEESESPEEPEAPETAEIPAEPEAPEENEAPETAEAPAEPAAWGLYVESFDPTALRRVLEAFALTAPARGGPAVTKRTLLLYACLLADEGLLGLSALKGFSVEELAEFLEGELPEAEGVQVCELSWMALPPVSGPRLCLGRLEDRAQLCLTGCSQAEAERFLPRLRDTLQALDRHIR